MSKAMSAEALAAELLSTHAKDTSYEEWLSLGMSIYECWPNEEGLKVWDGWSKDDPRYIEGDCAKRWSSFGAKPPAVPRSPWPSICDSVGGDLGPEFGPDKVRVVLGDVKLTNQDLIHVASMSPALMLVVNERREQIEKHRHTQGLDRAYRHEELAFASACYIIPSFGHTGRLSYWPWTAATFKPAKAQDQPGQHPQIKARIKDLTKGLALGLAELERLTTFLKELEDE